MIRLQMMEIEPKRDARIAAVVLAAGLSRRAGARNKLLAPVDGFPMVSRVVETAIAGKLSPVVPVTGHESWAIVSALDGMNVKICHNKDFEEGMATSIRAGIGYLSPDIDGVMILLGDMPWVQVETIQALVNAFTPVSGAQILRPMCDGDAGNPVLFSRHYFPALKALRGDQGAKHLIEAEAASLTNVSVRDNGIFQDLDTLPD